MTMSVCLSHPSFELRITLSSNFNFKAPHILFQALSQTRTIHFTPTVTERRRSLENFKNSKLQNIFHIQGGAGRGLPGSRSDQGLWRGVFPRPRLFPPPPRQILTPEHHHHNIRPGMAAVSRPSPGWSRGNLKCQAQVSSLLSYYSLTHFKIL